MKNLRDYYIWELEEIIEISTGNEVSEIISVSKLDLMRCVYNALRAGYVKGFEKPKYEQRRKTKNVYSNNHNN